MIKATSQRTSRRCIRSVWRPSRGHRPINQGPWRRPIQKGDLVNGESRGLGDGHHGQRIEVTPVCGKPGQQQHGLTFKQPAQSQQPMAVGLQERGPVRSGSTLTLQRRRKRRHGLALRWFAQVLGGPASWSCPMAFRALRMPAIGSPTLRQIPRITQCSRNLARSGVGKVFSKPFRASGSRTVRSASDWLMPSSAPC